jgi:hypothetical protein
MTDEDAGGVLVEPFRASCDYERFSLCSTTGTKRQKTNKKTVDRLCEHFEQRELLIERNKACGENGSDRG